MIDEYRAFDEIRIGRGNQIIFFTAQKLTWQRYIKTKRQQLNLKVRQMSWLLGRKSKLSLEKKTRL
jgi:hypothetical protein